MSFISLLSGDIIKCISLQCSYEEVLVIFELADNCEIGDNEFWLQHIEFNYPTKNLQMLFEDALKYHRLYYFQTLIVNYKSTLVSINDYIYKWFTSEGDITLIYFIVDQYLPNTIIINRLIPYMFNKYVEGERYNNTLWNALLYIVKNIKNVKLLWILMDTLNVKDYDLLYMLIHEQEEQCKIGHIFCSTCKALII